MRQIASGVYTLPLEYEFMGEQRVITPAALETERGLLLIDVGLPAHVEALETHFADAGFGFSDIETIVITHQDGDHAGGLKEGRERSGATVAAHVDDTPYIDGDRQPIKEDDHYPPAPVDIEVVDGVQFRTAAGPARVVAIPGHTPGHISLYLPDDHLLIAADALTAEDGLAGPIMKFTPDEPAAVESVGRLAELTVERTLCYHGGLVEHDADRIGAVYAALE
jgi:glyoxylase-like metal-dependent hydrolase (beta-lactamase superfamily II)